MSKSSNQILPHTHSRTANFMRSTTSSTETDNTADSNASRATTPDTPETVYFTPDTNKVDNKFDDPAPANINELKQAEERHSSLATVDASSFDNIYNYSHLSPSHLEVSLIMERLDRNCRYVQMTCGYWYALEDDDEIRPMPKAEYQEFIQWTRQTSVVTRDDFDKKQQADAEEGVMTSNAIAIIESVDDEEESESEQFENHTITPEE